MVTRARAGTRAKANTKRSQTGARLSTQASTGSFEAVTATAKKRKAEESTAEQVSDKIDETQKSAEQKKWRPRATACSHKTATMENAFERPVFGPTLPPEMEKERHRSGDGADFTMTGT